MGIIHWYDWVTPTTPLASVMFGLIASIIVGLLIWNDTKKWKHVAIALMTGAVVSVVGAFLLNVIGFYS
ncbi:hypothetical protein [Thalassobacillus sp. CUG 92003]|uniref:hypothetical protein n=1 Tax=Thalassobacillus sp. CUG 92003 TaxID=2736641 RepID=UPI0015E7036B|nr:hypothetical protein [Thalassobacillus sp. CUG 92003]